MIPWISRGIYFFKLLKYLFGPGEKNKPNRAKLIGGNMCGINTQQLVTEFEVSRQLRPSVVNPCWHSSLSFPIGEVLSTKKLNMITGMFLKKLKINSENHQFCIVRHNDTDHDHIHIIVSRIGLDGKLWGGANDVMKAIKAAKAIEKKMNLKITPGYTGPVDEKKMSKNEIEQTLRKNKSPRRAILQEVLKAALKEKPTFEVFIERLEAVKVEFKLNMAKTGHVSGISFKYENIAFKGSRLGKLYSWPGLLNAGLQYDEKQDKNKYHEYEQLVQIRTSRPLIAKDSNNLKDKKNEKIEQERINAKVSESDGHHQKGSKTHQKANRRTAKPSNREYRSVGSSDRAVSSSNGISKRRHPTNNDQDTTKEHRAAKKSNKKNEGDNRPLEKEPTGSFRSRTTSQEFSSSNKFCGSGFEKIKHENQYKNLSSIDNDQFYHRDSCRHRILALSQIPLHINKSTSNMATRNSRDCNKKDDRMIKHLETKRIAVKRQLDSLQSKSYRVTLTDPTQKRKPHNLGKGKGENKTEYFYSGEEVIKMLPFLSAKNAQGMNIFITPIDNHHFIVLDDTTESDLKSIEKMGFSSCLALESSPGNIQAIFKISKLPGGKTEQQAANELVQRINRRFGDKNFSGVIHPFRLAGFTNRKIKHRDSKGNFPYVRIKKSEVGTCKRLESVLGTIRGHRLKELIKRQNIKYKKDSETRRRKIKNVDVEDIRWDRDINVQFRQERKKWEVFAQSKGWPFDDSKLDFRACKNLLKTLSKQQVEQALTECSPAIEQRHKDFNQYAKITVENAEQQLLNEADIDHDINHGLNLN